MLYLLFIRTELLNIIINLPYFMEMHYPILFVILMIVQAIFLKHQLQLPSYGISLMRTMVLNIAGVLLYIFFNLRPISDILYSCFIPQNTENVSMLLLILMFLLCFIFICACRVILFTGLYYKFFDASINKNTLVKTMIKLQLFIALFSALSSLLQNYQSGSLQKSINFYSDEQRYEQIQELVKQLDKEAFNKD